MVALTRAFYWQQLLYDGVVASGSDTAGQEGLHHLTVNELLRLTLLEPAVTSAVVPAQSFADGVGGAAGGGGGVRRMTMLRALDHSCNFATAFGALAH